MHSLTHSLTLAFLSQSLQCKTSDKEKLQEQEAIRLATATSRRDAEGARIVAKLLAQVPHARSPLTPTLSLPCTLELSQTSDTQLHSCLPEDARARLIADARGALREVPPTVKMPDFANRVIELCRQHAGDDEVRREWRTLTSQGCRHGYGLTPRPGQDIRISNGCN